MLKIIRSSKLKKMITTYISKEFLKNELVAIYFKAIYSARIFGICVIRKRKLWEHFVSRQ